MLRSFVGGLGGKDISQAEFDHVLEVLQREMPGSGLIESGLLMTQHEWSEVESRLAAGMPAREPDSSLFSLAARLSELFRQKFGEIMTVGLGDGANDLPLLQAVDQPFLLPAASTGDNPDGSAITGPAAWAAIINRILDEL